MWRRAKSAAHGRRTALPVGSEAARAHERSEAPASCQTKRPSNQGRRSPASPSCRTAALCPGRGTARSGCGEGRPASAVGRCADTRATRGAGVQSNRASIARRRSKGRRSSASPPCRTATLCPHHRKTRSGSGKMSRGNWHVWLPCAGRRRISPGVSSPRSSRTVGLFRFRVSASRRHGM